MVFKVPEKYRSSAGLGRFGVRGDNFGAFQVPSCEGVAGNRDLVIIASAGDPNRGIFWEHVSARAVVVLHGKAADRVPTWSEMCQLKDLFWSDEDVVMQLHPSKSSYINTNANVLHLWRPVPGFLSPIPVPPTILV